MTPGRIAAALTAAAFAGATLAGCASHAQSTPVRLARAATPATPTLSERITRHLEDASLRGASVAVHIESLIDGHVLFSQQADTRMMPASALKIVTAAVAGERLGWSHRFETRLEGTGPIVDGVLQGDLIVVGTGDPSINAQDLRSAPLFDSWAATLREAGIRRVSGRLIGDDHAFDDEPLGAGWAWDYLAASYAAPSGALSYNENLVAIRIKPGAEAGAAASFEISPTGHDLSIESHVTTVNPGEAATITIDRLPGSSVVRVRGRVPAGAPALVRATTIENPTRYFVEALRLALESRAIRIDNGAWDIDDLPVEAARNAPARRVIASHESLPLSSLVAQMMKTSQNFYAEMLLKAVGRTHASAEGVGSTERGRQVVRETLQQWGVPIDSLVMYDGSGLSRYNYTSARVLTSVLRRMWTDERHRSAFAASLPVAGHDGTLGSRMTGDLRRRVQAKTGTISNVRSLAGYAETASGAKLVFAMLANHFTASNADVDRVMENILADVLDAAARP